MRHATAHSVRELTSLPGCSQVVVSHSMYMKPASRGVGLCGSELRQAMLTAKHLGYDYYLCTVDVANSKQVKVLEKAGFARIDSFMSSKTDHRVALYGRALYVSL